MGCNEDNLIYSLINDNSEYKIGDYVQNIDSVDLLAPCKPKKIIAIAKNFTGNMVKEYENYEPLLFIKPSTSICNPNDLVFNPFPDLPIWGEPELAVVVKNKLKNVSIEEAHDGILGYTCANDITVENINGRDHHLARSKCPDNFCPLGPWIDTKFDSSNCLIEGIQNDRIVRSGYSNDQIMQWPEIIKHVSQWITLEPWDIILTGNPPDYKGGMETTSPGMVFLNNGDIFTVKIKGLGQISNKIIVSKK